jgi:hypothetical protein
MAKIVIQVDDEEFDATLDEQSAPETVRRILDALPIEAKASTWGEEIYFSIPVEAGLENGVETVRVGDLGYWPDGSAFCIFFGKTLISASLDEIKPASAVNPIGRIEDAEELKRHSAGETVRITAGG